MCVVSPRSANAIASGSPTCPQPPTTATSDVKAPIGRGAMLDGLRNASETTCANLPRGPVAPCNLRVVRADPPLYVLDTPIGIIGIRIGDVSDRRSDDVDRR